MHKQKLRIWMVLDELLCAKIRVREGLKCLVGMKQVFISLSFNAVRCVHVREEGTAKRRKKSKFSHSEQKDQFNQAELSFHRVRKKRVCNS